jgi:hypothetical protein
VARRNDATARIASLLRDVVVPLDDDDFVSRLGEKIGCGYADYAATDDCNLLLCRHCYCP